MSISRQPGSGREPAVRGYSVTHPAGSAVLPIEPGWDQLLYAASGVMTVSTPAGLVGHPAARALWIPDGAPATVHTRGRVAVQNALPVVVVAIASRADPRRERSAVGPRAAAARGAVVPARPRASRPTPRCSRVLLDQLRIASRCAAPTSPAARRACGRPRGRAHRRSRRSTSRCWRRGSARAAAPSSASSPRETGMTLGAWRRRARGAARARAPRGRNTVTATAAAVGYATPSSFVASFKQELGHPPGRLAPRTRREPLGSALQSAYLPSWRNQPSVSSTPHDSASRPSATRYTVVPGFS